MNSDKRIALIRKKVERANQHFAELVVIRDRFMQSQPYAIESKFDPQIGHDTFYVTNLRQPSEEIGILAGDAIHNLRAALDHLAYQLVILNGGTPTTGTCFPIHDGTSLDKPRFERQVRGMAQAAIDEIAAINPCEGGNRALWCLHKLDIADKHHGLLIAIVSMKEAALHLPNFSIGRSRIPAMSFPNFGKPLKDGDVIFTCEPNVDKDTDFALDIAINQPEIIDPKPIVGVIERLIQEVDAVILSFKPFLD